MSCDLSLIPCAYHVTSHILLPPAPGDYDAIVDLTVTFQPGDTTLTETFSTVSDGVIETTENFTGQLTTTDAQVSIFQATADVNIVEIDRMYLTYN